MCIIITKTQTYTYYITTRVYNCYSRVGSNYNNYIYVYRGKERKKDSMDIRINTT